MPFFGDNLAQDFSIPIRIYFLGNLEKTKIMDAILIVEVSLE